MSFKGPSQPKPVWDSGIPSAREIPNRFKHYENNDYKNTGYKNKVWNPLSFLSIK